MTEKKERSEAQKQQLLLAQKKAYEKRRALAEAKMTEEEPEIEQETEQEPEKASGVPSWLWWVLGALAVGALASSSSSSEECLFVADSQGNLRECRPGE